MRPNGPKWNLYWACTRQAHQHPLYRLIVKWRQLQSLTVERSWPIFSPEFHKLYFAHCIYKEDANRRRQDSISSIISDIQSLHFYVSNLWLFSHFVLFYQTGIKNWWYYFIWSAIYCFARWSFWAQPISLSGWYEQCNSSPDLLFISNFYTLYLFIVNIMRKLNCSVFIQSDCIEYFSSVTEYIIKLFTYLLHTPYHMLSITRSLLHAPYYTLSTTCSLIHALYHTLSNTHSTTCSLIHALYHTLPYTPYYTLPTTHALPWNHESWAGISIQYKFVFICWVVS